MSVKFQLTGRIESSENINGKYHSVLATPAEDAYSKPNAFKLRSDYALGNQGEEVTCDVELTGYVREKPYKDKDTGYSKVYREPNVFMDAKRAQPKTQVKSA